MPAYLTLSADKSTILITKNPIKKNRIRNIVNLYKSFHEANLNKSILLLDKIRRNSAVNKQDTEKSNKIDGGHAIDIGCVVRIQANGETNTSERSQ